jgi:hypothetical protein
VVKLFGGIAHCGKEQTMSRYICIDGIETLIELEDALEYAPSIDIVRCKECKYDGTWKCPWRNTQVPRYPSANEFCSHGEREDE